MEDKIYEVDENIMITDDAQQIFTDILELIRFRKPENVTINVKVTKEDD